MQRLVVGNDHEKGAVAVIVAILMVVLLGFVAIAVDVGVVSSERSQLQNGADSAAIALAQKCARNDSLCSPTSSVVTDLANANALDGLSNVESIQLDQAAAKVTVTTTAKQAGGTDNSVSLFFANALGVPSKEVRTTSSAAWGSPTAGRTAFPLTFSICQVQDQVDGALQLLQDHGSNANPDCNYGPSGAAVDGGFGWLLQDAGKCGGTIDLATSEGGSNPGNNAPSNCDSTLNGWGADIKAGRKVVVLLPIFNAVTGTGSSAIYNLIAFAAFSVTGWSFTGNAGLPYEFQSGVSTATGVTAATACTGSCRGIIGKFITYVSLADGYALGPVEPYGKYGATIARLTL